jgi:Tfp pilus assembly protein FimT
MGFSLIEVVIAVAVLAAVIGVGALALDGWFGTQRAKGAVRRVADLMMLGRTEAVRTRQNHVVLFQLDAAGNPLLDASGAEVAGLLFRDGNGDGAPQSGEYVSSLRFDQTASLSWGGTLALQAGAEVPAPNDNPTASFPLPVNSACCTFTDTGGGPARGVVFLPDGMPRAFSVGPFATGAVGSGNGAVYVTSGKSDYAVVLAALGGVRVHAWEAGAGAWRQ